MSKRSDELLGHNEKLRELLGGPQWWKKPINIKPSLWRRVILYFQGVDWRTTAKIEEIK